MAWSLARLDFDGTGVSIYPPSQTMPSWSASNSVWTEETIPVKHLAFLPVLPYRVTEYATVYSAMKKFTEIGSQLLQTEIPMYCDEGVYRIVKKIQLMRSQEFHTLVPVMGTFHLVKIVLKCIGKAIAGSGADITWLQAGVFGPTVIQNYVLSGGHYSRSLESLQFLAESFKRLLYKEFFAENGIKLYAPALALLEKLKSSVSKKDINNSQLYMDEFVTASKKLVEDLDSFLETSSTANENFQFLTQFLRMMDVVYDLLTADREGIWELHLDAVQRALYLFAAFDSTNYLRWCVLYLEDMLKLPPSVYANFSNGNFSIKDKPGHFTAVGGDQNLEQNINLSSKCSDGVIGHAKQKQYVAQWDLIYHEMRAVKNLHREYTGVMENTHESCVNHHESSKAVTNRKENQIQEMIKFIEEKGSPLSTKSSTTLQNFVTKEIMTPDIRNDTLNAFAKGEEKYKTFRLNRLVLKTTRLSENIHRLNLKTVNTIRHKPLKTIKKAVNELNFEEKAIEIARDRGITTEELLEYDVAPSPILFTDDGMMTNPDKSQLLKELETCLKPEDCHYVHQKGSAFVIDTMATVRKVHVTGLSIFQDFLSAFTSLTYIYHQFGRCDYVFDMYSNDPSVKDSERMRRTDTLPIELSSIEPATPLPKEMTSFWSSNINKLLLEKLMYSHILGNDSQTRQYPTVVGQLTKEDDTWQCIMTHKGTGHVLTQLQSLFEEADLRIPLHVLDCLRSGHTVCVVISNDTDVIVSLLYHLPIFLQHGMEELWVRASIGDTTRYVPLHKMYKRACVIGSVQFCLLCIALQDVISPAKLARRRQL